MILTYNLPDAKDPKIFGPEFWKAFHDIASKIPCDECKEESETFVIFWHDLKNYDLGKEIFDKENFDYWLTKIEKIRKKKLKLLLSFLAGVVITVAVILIIKKR